MKDNITVQIVADSVNPGDQRITSFLLTYPRFIHSELMTHRMFSRNAASSRAIPISKVRKQVWGDPAYPERWGTNGRGMQDHGTHKKPKLCLAIWRFAAKGACVASWALEKLGLHKQIVNRVLEPFSRITTLVTATCFDNFFKLRAHKDAQPEFQVLAYKMLAAFLANQPEPLRDGEWHMPFAPRWQGQDNEDPEPFQVSDEDRLVQSVASCARTSYTTHDKEHSWEKQKQLVEMLATSGHWSPFEHQARAIPKIKRSNNFVGGWYQYRQSKEYSLSRSKPPIDLKQLLEAKPDWVRL